MSSSRTSVVPQTVGWTDRSILGPISHSRLTVGSPADVYEREADRAAHEVVSRNSSGVAWSLSRITVAPPLQRECECGGSCDDCKKRKWLQREAITGSPVEHAPSNVNEVLQGSGHSLDTGTRDFMESRFGYNFANVRIYDDASAANSAKSLKANAYTVGEKIVFNQGKYSPNSQAGQRLIAHELAHVVQQGDSTSGLVQCDAIHRDENSGVPLIVNEVLREPGEPLDTKTRTSFERRFGEKFGDVRVHTGSKAAQSAQMIHARAYTVGKNVVFDNGQFAPTTFDGELLLAHELSHSLQQKGKRSQMLAVAPIDSAHEREANNTAISVVAGETLTNGSRRIASHVSEPIIQKLDWSSDWENLKRRAKGKMDDLRTQASTAGDQLATVSTNAYDAVRTKVKTAEDAGVTAIENAITLSKVTTQVVKQTAIEMARSAKEKASTLDQSARAKASAAVSVVRRGTQRTKDIIEATATNVQQRAPKAVELAKTKAKKEIGAAVQDGLGNLKGTALQVTELAEAVVWLGAEGVELDAKLTECSIRAGFRLRDAMGIRAKKPDKELIAETMQPYKDAAAAIRGIELTASASAGFDKASVFFEKHGIQSESVAGGVFNSYEAGELKGAFKTQVGLALVGGKEVQIVVAGLSSVNSVKHMLETYAKKPDDFYKEPSFWMEVFGLAGNLVGIGRLQAKGKILKLFLSALQSGPLAAGAVFAARQLIQDYRNAELKQNPESYEKRIRDDWKSLVQAVSAILVAIIQHSTAKHGALEKSSDTNEASGRTTPEAIPESTPKPNSAPIGLEPIPLHERPHSPSKISDTSKPRSVKLNERAIVKEDAIAKAPADNGHEAVVTKEGIGRCSPSPCPVIHVEFAVELKGNPKLENWHKKIQSMRESHPNEAALEAAALIRTLEAARSNSQRHGAGEDMNFKLDVGEKRAEKIRRGEKQFVKDRALTVDVDEVQPVGEPNLDPAIARARALDPYNRQLLDPSTNRRTKYLGIDLRELREVRGEHEPTSISDNPNALITKRFSEVHELKSIFDRAVASIKDPGKLSPSALKERINKETRRIITEDQGPDAVAVRKALVEIGFEHVAGVGFVMMKSPPSSH